MSADLWVWTEAPPSRSTSGDDRVCSRHTPFGPWSWVAIEGPGVVAVPIEPCTADLAVAARTDAFGQSVVVLGSVLPWSKARTDVPQLRELGATASECFARVVDEHAARLRYLLDEHSDALVIWAGDFNQSLDGPNTGGSEANRDYLIETLKQFEFEAWNGAADHFDPRYRTIDLICGPSGTGKLVRTFADISLSDHAAYVVEINL